MMKTLSKAFVGTLTAGAMAAFSVSPAFAGGHDYRGDERNYGWSGNPRQAVAQCVRATESYAARNINGRASVVDVREVRDTRNGFQVKGRVAVNTMGGDWRRGDGYYGGYRNWNDPQRGYDTGSFRCRIDRGRVVDIDIDGIRGF